MSRAVTTLVVVATGLLLVGSVAAGPVAATQADVERALEPSDPVPADATDLATANLGPEESVTARATSESRTASNSQATSESNIRLTQRLSLVPDQPGTYEASHRYRVPDHLRVLEVTLPEGATVVSAVGFRQRDGRTYEWDGTTTQPRIDYRLPANQSIDQTGPIGGPGRLTFVDVGEWALVSQPRTSHSWGWTQGGDRVGFEREMAAETGAAGDAIAYLGEYEAYTTSAHGQQFRLIVPERADLAESPEEILASFAAASDQLRVGDRDETVVAIAAPTPEGLEWGVRGLQAGGSDLWVRDVETLDEANNVWLHEYVHTRQAYATAADSRWVTEASAVYYAALLTLEQDRIRYAAFRERLAFGEASYGGSVLAQPETWQGNPNYFVGPLVTGELDRRLRVTTGGQTTFQEVFRRMNAESDVVTAADIGSFLRATGGSEVEQVGERYTTTTQRPSAWDAETHRDAFGAASLPARITYGLPGTDDGVRVDGPYRTRALGSANPVTLVPGERLVVDVVATNFGEGEGEFEAVFRVDDERRTVESGRLAAGESTTLTFEHVFNRTGPHVVSVGDASVRVTVREPATLQVTDLSVDSTAVETGESVAVAVDVRNGHDYPGRLDLPITRNGEAVETRTVRLDAGAEETVRAELQFEEPGTYVVGVGNTSSQTAVVTVTDEPEETESEGQTGGSTPGFGPVVAVAAILLWTVGRRRFG